MKKGSFKTEQKGSYVMNIIETIQLGTFENISGSLVISDPCYTTDVWCMGTLHDVKCGLWCAQVVKSDEGDWGIRNAVLLACHADLSSDQAEKLEMVESTIVVGVDSGQAGIFDEAHYRDDSVFGSRASQFIPDAEEKGEAWYGHCCDATLSEIRAGILPFGVVASSGYGDGSYVCSYGVDAQGEIVKVSIQFIWDED